ncbi:hypothetical protein [Streptomyces sp. NPDC002758]
MQQPRIGDRGLGADSTAYLAKMLTDPAAHGIDLERTAVLYMATGSEWPETRLLVEQFMLPLLREHGVRFVQLSRSGHLKADGITVLDDSSPPRAALARGPWTLWDEMESVGTVPQQAGTRKCSLRAKGDVGDRWLTPVMGGRPFRQVMGFNADEEGRRFGDQTASKIPGRTGAYPLWAASTPAGEGLRIAQAFGCTSADGTYLAFGPDTNLPRLLAWMNELHATPTLFAD